MMNKQLKSKHQPIRKLDRRNATKNIDYDATPSPSLDLRRTSFRVEGLDGDFDLICRSLGLSGPDDFAIPADAWEARKSRSLAVPVRGDIVSCESGSGRNLDRFRVAGSKGDNLLDTVEAEVRVSDALCVDHIGHCDELSSEFVSDRNSEKFRVTGLNRDNPLDTGEAKIGVIENERNENGASPAKIEVRVRDCNGVACELGDHHNLEQFGDNSSETFEPKVRVRESKRNGSGFSQGKKNGFSPANIEVGVRRTDESRGCEEELSTSSGAGRNRISVRSFRSSASGIKGSRPPVLAPPPVMLLSQNADNTSTSWDLLQSLGPPSDENCLSCIISSLQDKKTATDDTEKVDRRRRDADGDTDGEWLEDVRALSESCSDSEDKNDDCINVTVEPLHFVSPLGKFKCTINSWQKGDFLGSGSFGTVYEGFTDDGIFFAVKEVSLLDQGDQGKQSIYQLEQEIFFLSQFEHENIVQYLGTDKDKEKLYIFLELVTKGSLASLYQKYNLQDSQVSAYTRQILSGLNYLHLRKVVHRDVKCANILVDASGSVKLADFGLAKATNLNNVKSCKGTAFWMAPEVVNRKNHGYGLAADIWSLGCTVLEMLTRRIPYSHLEGV